MATRTCTANDIERGKTRIAREYWIPVACCMLQGEWRVGVALHSWMTVSIKLKLISIRYAQEKLTQYSMWQREGDKFQLHSIKSCSIFITYFNFNIEWKLKLSVLNWNVQKCTKIWVTTNASINFVNSIKTNSFLQFVYKFQYGKNVDVDVDGVGRGGVSIYSISSAVCLSIKSVQSSAHWQLQSQQMQPNIESQTEPRESINRGLSTLYYNM